jgi:hypothetical protein
VGELYTFSRKDEAVELYFVADFGTGLDGLRSIEAVVAKPAGEELWLHRTQGSKWKRQLAFWANRVWGMTVPDIREQNLRPNV